MSQNGAPHVSARSAPTLEQRVVSAGLTPIAPRPLLPRKSLNFEDMANLREPARGRRLPT